MQVYFSGRERSQIVDIFRSLVHCDYDLDYGHTL